MEAPSSYVNGWENNKPHDEKFGAEYEYISDTIYAKDENLFNQINGYLITQSLIDPTKVIKINDPFIKSILSDSKEIDIESPYYNEMLTEWADKYNEDYIDRNGGGGYKFDIKKREFILIDTAEREEKFKNRVFSSVGDVKLSAGLSMIDAFRSIMPKKIKKSEPESKKIETINTNIKTMIKKIGNKAAMFGL